jgi:hypothetical protein
MTEIKACSRKDQAVTRTSAIFTLTSSTELSDKRKRKWRATHRIPIYSSLMSATKKEVLRHSQGLTLCLVNKVCLMAIGVLDFSIKRLMEVTAAYWAVTGVLWLTNRTLRYHASTTKVNVSLIMTFRSISAKIRKPCAKTKNWWRKFPMGIATCAEWYLLHSITMRQELQG